MRPIEALWSMCCWHLTMAHLIGKKNEKEHDKWNAFNVILIKIIIQLGVIGDYRRAKVNEESGVATESSSAHWIGLKLAVHSS